ncbi:MAG: tRNA 2-selenouridine(34) synthase MnmH [Bacillota bacterium]
MSKRIHPEQFKELFLRETPLIDVRAPVEFAEGSLPGAVNMPILNDEERALIGTTYKREGQDEAVRLGYKIVSGPVKEARVQAWSDYIEKYPRTVVYCFRGGKRSQITQQWLSDNKIDRPIIEGGYKAVRTFLMEETERYTAAHKFVVISGPTGSGKTHFLKALEGEGPVIDLEGLALHRGSAFGGMGVPQPSQINFENLLAVKMMKLDAEFSPETPVSIEDESRLIGSRSMPLSLFEKIRSSQVVWVDEGLETRVDNIFKDYILDTPIGVAADGGYRCAEEQEILQSEALKVFARYRNSASAIRKKLGGLRTQEILADLEFAEREFINSQNLSPNKVWIQKLLVWYYDPLYLGSLERRQMNVLFKGSTKDSLSFVKSLMGS